MGFEESGRLRRSVCVPEAMGEAPEMSGSKLGRNLMVRSSPRGRVGDCKIT